MKPNPSHLFSGFLVGADVTFIPEGTQTMIPLGKVAPPPKKPGIVEVGMVVNPGLQFTTSPEQREYERIVTDPQDLEEGLRAVEFDNLSARFARNMKRKMNNDMRKYLGLPPEDEDDEDEDPPVTLPRSHRD